MPPHLQRNPQHCLGNSHRWGDPNEPYILDSDRGECDEATHIVAAISEQESQTTIPVGAVTITGPDVYSVASITNASIATRETLNNDMSIEFALTAFDTTVPYIAAGSFELRDVQIKLAAPATGTLVHETVTFAPGTLRFTVIADGQPLFAGLPMIASFRNRTTATAIRSVNGTFHFADATFTSGDYAATLITQPAVLIPIQ